jgi:hypothetical protein
MPVTPSTATPVDPTVYKFLTYGFTASFGLITALMGKIVWDWLANRKARTDFCPLHNTHQQELDRLRQRTVDRDDFKELARQVKDGQQDIHQEIAKISRSIAVIEERIKDV